MSRTTRRLTGMLAGVGAGAGIVALLRNPRWRSRLHHAADGVHDTVLPPEHDDRPAPPDRPPTPVADEAHAPGKRHRTPPPSDPPPETHEPGRAHTVVDHRPGHWHKG